MYEFSERCTDVFAVLLLWTTATTSLGVAKYPPHYALLCLAVLCFALFHGVFVRDRKQRRPARRRQRVGPIVRQAIRRERRQGRGARGLDPKAARHEQVDVRCAVGCARGGVRNHYNSCVGCTGASC